MPDNLYTAFNQGMRLSRPWANAQGRYQGYYSGGLNRWLARTPSRDEDFFVYTIGPNPATNAALTLAPGVGAILNFQIQADSSFELWAITATSNSGTGTTMFPSQVTVQLSDGGSSRNLFSAPVPLALVAGQALNALNGGGLMEPHWLPVARRFVSNSQVNVSVLNIDTATTYSNFQISFIGRKIYNNGQQADAMGSLGNMFRKWRGADGKLYAEDYYGYVFNVPTLGSLATLPSTQVIESDSDFECVLLAGGGVRGGTTGIMNPELSATVQWTDGGVQRNLFSNPTNFGSLFGLGTNPMVLPVTRIFIAKSPVTWTLTSIDTGGVNDNIYILMEGRKIFQLSE